MLLRQLVKHACFLGVDRLDSGDCAERPTGAAYSLIFNGPNDPPIPPINGSRALWIRRDHPGLAVGGGHANSWTRGKIFEVPYGTTQVMQFFESAMSSTRLASHELHLPVTSSQFNSSWSEKYFWLAEIMTFLN